MSEISASSWSPTDASNTTAPPDGSPEGCAPSSVNDTIRAIMGGIKRSWQRSNAVLTSGGGTTAYTLTPTVALGSYVTGERWAFKANATSTGAATMNISALGAKNVYKLVNGAVAATVAGDILQDAIHEIVYDGTQFQLLNPAVVTPDINGLTAETAPATGDLVPLYDASASANRKMTLANLLTVLNSLTEDASPDESADFLLSYDTSASAVKKVKPSNLITSGVLQTVAGTPYTTNTDLSTAIPTDNTIPQITEGTEIITAAITLSNAANKVRLRFHGFVSAGSSTVAAAALFIDATAGALYATCTAVGGGGAPTAVLAFEFDHSPGDTAAHTYRVRVGPSAAGTIRMNGSDSARYFGGVAACTLVAEEVL